MSRVLITGVAGFIGSNLAEALLAAGHSVLGLDNLSQGQPRNMARCRTHAAFSFHEGDIRDPAIVDRLVGDVDTVYHLAAFKIPRYSSALNTLRINAHGTRTVLDAAARHGVHAIIASTSDCYGRNPAVPFHEQSDMWMGASSVKRWAYAVSKMYDEHLCYALLDQAKLRFTAIRFFGGYGPHQNLTWWGGPQSVFITAALRDQELELHGDGQQTRSFTFIGDHVNGLVRCLNNEKAVGQAFNLGNTREITIEGLARMIWSMAGRGEPKIKRISYRTFGKYEDVMRRVPDISKARELLGFEPRTHLEQGLPITIEWQRKVMAEEAGGAA